MPVDLSKLSDEELDAYLALKEGKKEEPKLVLPNLPGPHKVQMEESLPGLSRIAGKLGSSQEVFDKMMRTPLVPPGQGGNVYGQAKEKIKNAPAGQGNDTTTERTNRRVLGALLGAATAGPAGAALGTALPPDNFSDVAAIGTGAGAGKVLGSLTRGLTGAKAVLGSGAAGVAQNALMNGARQATGQEVDYTNPLQNLVAGGLPLALAGVQQSAASAQKRLAASDPILKAQKKAEEAQKFVIEQMEKIFGRKVTPEEINKLSSPALSESGQPGFREVSSPAGRVFGSTRAGMRRAEAAQAEGGEALRQQQARLASSKIDAQKAKIDAAGAVTDARAGNSVNQTTLKAQLDAMKRQQQRLAAGKQNEIDDLESQIAKPALEAKIKDFLNPQPNGVATQYDAAKKAIDEGLAMRDQVTGMRMDARAAKQGQLTDPMAAKVEEASQNLPLEKAVGAEKIAQLQAEVRQRQQDLLEAQRADKLYKTLDVPRIKETLRKNPVNDPNLTSLMDGVESGEAFVQKMDKANAAQITALRDYASQNGAKHGAAVGKELEETFNRRMFQMMEEGANGELYKPDKVLQAYPFEKMAAIYGGGLPGKTKASIALDVLKSVSDRIEAQKAAATGGPTEKNILNRFGTYAAGTGMYMFIRATMHANPKQMAMEGATLGLGALVVSAPKLMDYAVKNPKFGTQFTKFMQDRSPEDVLNKYPLVQKFFQDNNVNRKESPSSTESPSK